MAIEYYAHTRENPETGLIEYQTVEQHLRGTAELCAEFADKLNAKEYGELVGSLHDYGKCTREFLNRILNSGPRVDHSTAGAIICAKKDHVFLAACIAGHHSGLPDFGNMYADTADSHTLFGRIKKGISRKYVEKCGDSGVPMPDVKPYMEKNLLFASQWTRMMFSCETDADFLDTERFVKGAIGRGGYDSIETLYERLNKYVERWSNPQTELNKLRWQILCACKEAGGLKKGIYTLTVPTGGGKTIASLAFALSHALKHNMDRMVYVIPYNSIIEQNAGVFCDVVGEGNVLEHHSGVSFEMPDDPEGECAQVQMRRALASENWDMPVVATTAVQLFESMYANRASKCRKLHNLANSVIIFDEAQMLPVSNLRPCVAALTSLAVQFNSTVVLCTATQPALGKLIKEYGYEAPIRELCPQSEELYKKFRRVTFKRENKLSDDNIAARMGKEYQALCIVNTRGAARSIYNRLKGLADDGCFHLSKNMESTHLKECLIEIRNRLKNGQPCRVVSTQLIEAGVDVDFPAVYREMAGLDSILQASGRCNREGKRSADDSIVTIFSREGRLPRAFETQAGAAMEALDGGRDPGDPDTMTRYFKILLDLKGNALDKYGIISAFMDGIEGCELPFKTVAERFRMIDDDTYTIYIPRGDGAELIERLKAGESSRELYRRLGRRSVELYKSDFEKMYDKCGLLTAREAPFLDERSAILNDRKLYDEKVGLNPEAETDMFQ